MTGGQVFISLIILVIVIHTIYVFRKKSFGKLFMVFWLLIWVGGLILVLWPNLMQNITDKLGIGRVVDVIVYLAIVSIFYILFKFHIRMHDLENKITKLTRKIALMENGKK
ncbi:MAG: DUF2304 domain-containing protein [Pseudomonadales bacterium]|jgi:hypothetical protein|nr:DUF2304 domain-containing protein [Pseudomonadales bacterium]